MKHMVVMGILTVLALTVLSACGNTNEANPPQETVDITSDTIDAEFEEDADNTMGSELYTMRRS